MEGEERAVAAEAGAPRVQRTRSRSGIAQVGAGAGGAAASAATPLLLLDVRQLPPPPPHPPPAHVPPIPPPSLCAFVKLSEAAAESEVRVAAASAHSLPQEAAAEAPVRGRRPASKVLRRNSSFGGTPLNLDKLKLSDVPRLDEVARRVKIKGQVTKAPLSPMGRSPGSIFASPRYRHHPYISQLSPLLELLMRPGEPLLEALERVAQENEARPFVRPLINIYARTNLALRFLVRRVREELKETPEIGTMFRGVSYPVQYISAYWQIVGQQYIRQVLQPLVLLILSKEQNLEMDPNRLQNPGDVKVNTLNLMVTCREAFEHIRDSIYLFPQEMQMLCRHICTIADERFPGKGLLAVGAICFLRLFCPAIVSPESYGVISKDLVVTSKARRHLVLVSKVLQTLANLDVRFGEKEQYMVPMNVFLKNFNVDMRNLLTTMAMPPFKPRKDSSPRDILSRDIFSLHQVFWEYRDQIAETLGKRHEKISNVFQDFIMEVGEPMSQAQFAALEEAKPPTSRVISRIDHIPKKGGRKSKRH